MPSPTHNTLMELAKFLDLLQVAPVEMYRGLYNKNPQCQHAQRALIIFKRKYEQKVLQALEELYKKLNTESN